MMEFHKDLRIKLLSLFCVTIMIATGFVSIANTIKAEGGGGGGGGGSSNDLNFDLNIYETNSQPYKWKGSSPSYDAYFKEKSDSGHLAKFISNGHNFTYKIDDLKKQSKTGISLVSENQNVKGNINGVEIEYENIYDFTTLKYTMEFGQLKETYVIEKLPQDVDKEDLIFQSKLFFNSQKLDIYIDNEKKNGNVIARSPIEFRNETNKTIYRIPRPFLRDSPDLIWDEYKGEFAPDLETIDTKLCYYNLTIDGNHVDLNLIVSYSFLGPGNTYPLYLDPYIEDPVNSRITYEGLSNNTIRKISGNKFTFYLMANCSENEENDNFVFSYSKDDNTYYDMITIEPPQESNPLFNKFGNINDNYHKTFIFPDSISGTIYIRVKDTDQTPGNKDLNIIYIDNMFIRSETNDDLTKNDIPIKGTVTGDYLDTQTLDEEFEIIEEEESGGNPANRYSYLEHKWQIDLTGDSDISYYENVDNTIVQESDLIIQNGGILTLSNILLKIDSDPDPPLKIDVESGGTLNIVDNSKVTPYDTQNKYNFYYRTQSFGVIENSIIEYVGDVSKGIQVESNINIKNSIVQNNDLHGIYCYQSSPMISGSTIKNNIEDGIYCDQFSAPIITANTISNNENNGVSIISSLPIITNNIIETNDNYGIYMYNSFGAKISNNEITSNNYGIYLSNNPFSVALSDTISAYFYDDMESGTNGWTHSIVLGSGSDLWHQETSNYYSSTTSWYMGQDNDYPESIDSALMSPSIDLTELNNAFLFFWHDYEMEYGWDGGQVEISTDGGNNWAVITPEGGYDNTIQYDNVFQHSMVNEMAFTGNSGGWVNEIINITPYVGNSIKIRFHFASDKDSTNDKGWYIDDVIIQSILSVPIQTFSNISHNDISLHSYSGIYGYKSSIKIYKNNIYSNDVGIHCYQLNFEEPFSTILSDDMESEESDWSLACSHQPYWNRVTTDYYSPTQSWWSGYGNDIVENCLVSPPFSLNTYTTATLSFWHKYQLETNQDFGYVDITTDNGANWIPLRGYSNYYGPSIFEKEIIDISNYAGNPNVRIRFRFTTDSSVTYTGWYIDNVMVKSGIGVENQYNQATINKCNINSNNVGIQFVDSSPEITYSHIEESTYHDLDIEMESHPIIQSSTYDKNNILYEDIITDSDGDTICDNEEIYIHETNPLSTDSDSDGLPDIYESSNNKYIFEVEDYAWIDGQIKIDINASNNKTLTVHEGKNINNLFEIGHIYPGGLYKFYFRARSNNSRSIMIGADGTNLEEGFYTLLPEYQWHSSPIFNNNPSSEIKIWAHSSYTTDIYFDKIILIRLEDESSNPTLIEYGQITDPDSSDSDNDGASDLQEVGFNSIAGESNIWVFEAEEHLNVDDLDQNNDPVVAEIPHNDASNCKAIFRDKYYQGEVNLLDEDSFPDLLLGDEYKLYLRLKGIGCIDIYVNQGTSEFVHHTIYGISPTYRWYCTPVFVTQMGTNPRLEFEAYVPPPADGTIYLDKLMVVRIKDDNGIDTGIDLGQITDPLDSDTDMDKLLDGEETDIDVFWFEAEDCIIDRIYDNTNPPNNQYDSDSQIFDEQETSNNKVIRWISSSYTQTIDPSFIPDYMVTGNYRIYVRAKGGSSNPPDTIQIDDESNTEAFELTQNYKWFISSEISSSATSVNIYASSQDVKLDKLMLASVDSLTSGKISDPLDPDLDWDGLTDGFETNEFIHWFEAEHYPYISSQSISDNVEASNSKEISPDSTTGKIIDISIPLANTGEYKLYIKAYSPNFHSILVEIKDDLNNILVDDDELFLLDEPNWFSTHLFDFDSDTLTSITISVHTISTAPLYVDKFMLVKKDIGINYLTDPLDFDTDNDGIEDKNEIDSNIQWFECEDYISSGSEIDTDGYYSNGKATERDNNGEFYSISKKIPKGYYRYYVRAKRNDGTGQVTLKLKVNSLATQITIEKEVLLIKENRWYSEIEFFNHKDNACYTFSGIYDSVTAYEAYVDKIMIVRTIDEYDNPTPVSVGKVVGPGINFRIYTAHPGTISDPLYPDSDGDSLTDFEEIKGMVSGNYHEYGPTDPLSVDLDKDSLEDNIELEYIIGTQNENTNPNRADSDGDYLPDGWIDGWSWDDSMGYDDTQVHFAIRNQDGFVTLGKEIDGISYLEGEDINYNGIIDRDVNGYYIETNPIDVDTDNDGSNDMLVRGHDGWEHIVDSDPLDKDTDDDGLKDGDEIGEPYSRIVETDYIYEKSYGPNVLEYDTDGDGLTDGQEEVKTSQVYEENVDTIAGNDVTGTDTGPSSPFIAASSSGTPTNPGSVDTDKDGLPDGWIDGWGYDSTKELWGYPSEVNADYCYDDEIQDVWEGEDFNCDGVVETTGTWNPTPDSNGDHQGPETNPFKFDTDDGGISDGQEILYSDDYQLDSGPPMNNAQDEFNPTDNSDDDAYDDYDSDGLFNCIEDQYSGLDKYDADCDDDGLLDGHEFEGTNDFDGDGLINALDTDSDDDKLWDGLECGLYYDENYPGGDTIIDDSEVPTGIFATDTLVFGTGDADQGVTKTYPLDRDSDDDGLPDGWIDSWTYLNDYYENPVYEEQHDTFQGWGPFGETNGKQEAFEGEDFNYDGEQETQGYWNKDPNDEGYHEGLETKPDDEDSDDDSYWDGFEILDGLHPLGQDSDGDGLTDKEEEELGTEVGWKDSDGDTLEDGYEVLNDYDPYKDGIQGLNPNDPDTDDDNLPDDWEDYYFQKYKQETSSMDWLNPLFKNSNEGAGDDIGDDNEETLDYIEYDDSNNVIIFKDDCLSNYNELIEETDPTDIDTDGDGDLDGEELIWGSDPLDPDSKIGDNDNDGINDLLDNDDDNDKFSDFDEERVCFRTNAVDTYTLQDDGSYSGFSDGYLDYMPNTWVAIDVDILNDELEIWYYKDTYLDWPNRGNFLGITSDRYGIYLLAGNSGYQSEILIFTTKEYPMGEDPLYDNKQYRVARYTKECTESMNIEVSLNSIQEYREQEVEYLGTDPYTMDTDEDNLNEFEDICVLFRTNAADSDEDGKLEYIEGTWIILNWYPYIIKFGYACTDSVSNIKQNYFDEYYYGLCLGTTPDGLSIGFILREDEDSIAIGLYDPESYNCIIYAVPPTFIRYDDLEFDTTESYNADVTLTPVESYKNQEVHYYSNEPLLLQPTNPDSDEDGLFDGAITEGFLDTDNDLKINAIDFDSDNDMIWDGFDLQPTMTWEADDLGWQQFVSGENNIRDDDFRVLTNSDDSSDITEAKIEEAVSEQYNENIKITTINSKTLIYDGDPRPPELKTDAYKESGYKDYKYEWNVYVDYYFEDELSYSYVEIEFLLEPNADQIITIQYHKAGGVKKYGGIEYSLGFVYIFKEPSGSALNQIFSGVVNGSFAGDENNYQAGINIPYEIVESCSSDEIVIELRPVYISYKDPNSLVYYITSDLDFASVTSRVIKNPYVILSRHWVESETIDLMEERFLSGTLPGGSFSVLGNDRRYYGYLSNTDNGDRAKSIFTRNANHTWGLGYAYAVSEVIILSGTSRWEIYDWIMSTDWDGDWSEIINDDDYSPVYIGNIREYYDSAFVGYEKLEKYGGVEIDYTGDYYLQAPCTSPFIKELPIITYKMGDDTDESSIFYQIETTKEDITEDVLEYSGKLLSYFEAVTFTSAKLYYRTKDIDKLIIEHPRLELTSQMIKGCNVGIIFISTSYQIIKAIQNENEIELIIYSVKGGIAISGVVITTEYTFKTMTMKYGTIAAIATMVVMDAYYSYKAFSTEDPDVRELYVGFIVSTTVDGIICLSIYGVLAEASIVGVSLLLKHLGIIDDVYTAGSLLVATYYWLKRETPPGKDIEATANANLKEWQKNRQDKGQYPIIIYTEPFEIPFVHNTMGGPCKY